jgi:hypothetical protein
MIIMVCLLVIVLTACGITPASDTSPKQGDPQDASITNIPVTPGPTEAVVNDPIPDDSPEAAVKNILMAYQEDPAGMQAYLSSGLVAQLPAGGILEMMGLKEGMLEGFAIQMAAVNPDPPSAMVEVAIRTGGEDSIRRFILIKENGAWVIDKIETP